MAVTVLNVFIKYVFSENYEIWFDGLDPWICIKS